MNGRVNESVASAEKNHIELSMDYSSQQHATKGATFRDGGMEVALDAHLNVT